MNQIRNWNMEFIHGDILDKEDEFYLDEILLTDTRLYLGKIGDSDSTFLNGKYIGKRTPNFSEK